MNRYLDMLLRALSLAACVHAAGCGGGEDLAVSSSTQALGPDRGHLLFHAPLPGGNGRSCATCHVPELAFSLSPEDVQRRYRADPSEALFRSLDADDFGRDFTTLRTHGLVRVSVRLASNVMIDGDPSIRSVSLWRATPSIIDVVRTAPYQQDGRLATLQAQAQDAALGHIEVCEPLPTTSLNQLAAFERAQVSPPIRSHLDPAQRRGRDVFGGFCAPCHGTRAISPPSRDLLFLEIGVAARNLPDLPTHTFVIRDASGVEHRRQSPDPGRALITGDILDFEAFNVPPLRGIRRTAPYFHDNSARTLREVIEHYQIFVFPFIGLEQMSEAQIRDLLTYLEIL